MAQSIFDAISSVNSLDDAKNTFAQVMKNIQYKKGNAALRQQAQLSADIVTCCGKLERCKEDFLHVIRTQCANIQEGQRQGMDTRRQEQLLWDAAMGYLLLRDAVYAVQTDHSYNSVEYAYELLVKASEQVKEKAHKHAFFSLGGKKRNEAGFLSVSTVVEDKKQLLNEIFDKLKLTGDLEACLEERLNPRPDMNAGGASVLDDEMRRLRALDGSGAGEEKIERPEGMFNFTASPRKE